MNVMKFGKAARNLPGRVNVKYQTAVNLRLKQMRQCEPFRCVRILSNKKLPVRHRCSSMLVPCELYLIFIYGLPAAATRIVVIVIGHFNQ
jgi:hypothetical protein